MQSIKKISQQFEGEFIVLDFHLTHLQLLLRRSVFKEDHYENLDLRFELVRYIELPFSLHDIHIENGSETDWEYIRTRYNGEIYNTPEREIQYLYKITSEGKKYFILAGHIVMSVNKLDDIQSSITTPRTPAAEVAKMLRL